MHHKPQALTLGIVIALLLAACTAAPAPLVTPPASTHKPTVTPAPPKPTATAKPSPAPTQTWTPVPEPEKPLLPNYITRPHFVDALHGWMIGQATWGNYSVFATASTSDGGKTWQAIPPPVMNIYGVSSVVSPQELHFLNDKEGWAYDPGLFSTHDGGLTWVDEQPAAKIVRFVKAADSTLWALEEEECECEWKLLSVSATPHQDWQSSTVKFPADMGDWGTKVAMADSQHIWILYSSMESPGAHLFSTRDGGATWTEEPSPCPEPLPLFVDIEVVDRQHLWLGCGDATGAGAWGTTHIFTTSDAGDRWELVAKGELPPQNDDNMEGAFVGLIGVSSKEAFVSFYRQSVISITNDGGKTWMNSYPFEGIDDFGYTFIDALHGWAFTDSILSRTTDGGKTWECIQISGGSKISCSYPFALLTSTPQ
jgi:photosystem II stability/assembly factor-like uncharacterized protein